MEIKKVTVIGGGTMGRQIALNAAVKGFEVRLNDSFPGVLDAVGEWSKNYLSGRVAKGKMSEEAAADIAGRFVLEADLKKAAEDADLVIEAIIEDLEIKKELFSQLDVICPEKTIFASNSSTFFPSQYSSVTNRAHKVVGLHYFNPALVMQLVELILSADTDPDTLESVKAFGEAIGKSVIVVKKEIEGFIVNNLFGGITNVAWYLLENGFASVEDIDIAAEKGLGHPMGPFRTMDHSGLDTILNVRKSRHEMNPEKHPAPTQLLVDKVAKGETGVKAGRGFYDYSKK